MTISDEYGVSLMEIRFNHKLRNRKTDLPACFVDNHSCTAVAHDNQLGMCLFVWRAHFVRKGREKANHDLTGSGV